MGSAQSQSSRSPRGSIAHPAVSAALKISALSVLNLMADLLGRLECANTGVRAADSELSLCGEPAQAKKDPKSDANGRTNRTPIGKASANPCEEHCE
jgi:hypothetical protein